MNVAPHAPVWTIPKEMRALVYRGKDDLRVETLPVPRIGSRELLVKVAACGVCPTDIKKIKFGTVEPPRIFGHETAGTIVKVGSSVKGFRIGQRVALHHHVPCLDCHFCRHRAFAQCSQYKRTGITAGFEPAGGGYAEYVRVMEFVLPGVVRIPVRNTVEEGAMLEPVNTVLKAVKRLNLLRGDYVLVVGQGPIGLIFTRILALAGMRVIATDLIQSRLKMAKSMGAISTLRADRLDEPGSVLHPPLLFGRAKSVKAASESPVIDAVVIAAASDEAVRAAEAVVRGGGQILLFAHTRRGSSFDLDLSTVCVDEKDLIGSYSSDFHLQEETARLVFSRRLDVRQLITHRFPVEQGAAAIDLAAAPPAGALKIFVSGADTKM